MHIEFTATLSVITFYLLSISFQELGLKLRPLEILARYDIMGWSPCTIALHCSEMASLSDGTSGQSKNLKKVSKLLARASQITYFILVLIYR